MINNIRNMLFTKKFQKLFNTKIYPTNIFNTSLIRGIGRHCYGSMYLQSWNPDESITIGNFVSIADNVVFQLGGNHNMKKFSTYPLHIDNSKISENRAFAKGPIIIKDDVWIGSRSLILSGVTLEQGTVVAAGSVVTKSTPPYSVVGGNPARVLKYRFSDEIITLCNEIFDYSKLTDDFISNNIELFESDIDKAILFEIRNKLNDYLKD